MNGTAWDVMRAQSLIKRGTIDALSPKRYVLATSVALTPANKTQLVAEIDYTEWTKDGRLRHPSYKGLRDDYDPKDVVRD